jgi:hypothetical protein
MIAIQKIMADLTKITQKAKGRQRFTKIRIIVIKETRNPTVLKTALNDNCITHDGLAFNSI